MGNFGSNCQVQINMAPVNWHSKREADTKIYLASFCIKSLLSSQKRMTATCESKVPSKISLAGITSHEQPCLA